LNTAGELEEISDHAHVMVAAVGGAEIADGGGANPGTDSDAVAGPPSPVNPFTPSLPAVVGEPRRHLRMRLAPPRSEIHVAGRIGCDPDLEQCAARRCRRRSPRRRQRPGS
jgi:hypothetical protein